MKANGFVGFLKAYILKGRVRFKSLCEDIKKQKSKNKLLPLNEVLTHPVVIKSVLIIVPLLFLIFGNVVIQSFSRIGAVLNGTAILYEFLVFDLKRYGFAYLVLLGLGILTGLLLVYKIKVNFTDMNIGQKGIAEFATLAMIQETYKEIPEKDKPFPGRGGLIVSRSNDKLYIDDTINNNFILALTRGGKGELFVLPSIDNLSRAETKSSLVVIDVKGELFRASAAVLHKRGYKLGNLNLANTENSMFFNPLELSINFWEQGKIPLAEQACRKIAFSLFEDPATKDRFWVEAPIALFTAVAIAHIQDCLAAGHREWINMYSITWFILALASDKDAKGQSRLDSFFLSRPLHDKARLKYATILFSEGKTRSSVFAITAAKLQVFTYENIAKITCQNTMDLADLGFHDKPTAIFVQVPYNDKSFHPLVSIFISQAYFALSQRANLDENKNKCKLPVKFVGDEIFNAPPIESFENILAVCLGSNISFDLYAQSYDQVKVMYKDSAPIILDNCSTQVYIMSQSKETREMFSEKLGNTTIKTTSRGGSRFSLEKNLNETYEQRPLLTPNELMTLKEGETVIIPVLKRKDLDGKRIVSRPIFNTGETALKYRYEYLTEFDPDAEVDFEALSIPRIGNISINLQNVIYEPTETHSPAPLPQVKPAIQRESRVNPEKRAMIQNKLRNVGISYNLSDLPDEGIAIILKEALDCAQIAETDYKACINLLQRK